MTINTYIYFGPKSLHGVTFLIMHRCDVFSLLQKSKFLGFCNQFMPIELLSLEGKSVVNMSLEKVIDSTCIGNISDVERSHALFIFSLCVSIL